ncbi:MAG: hypothetical protein HOQ32_09365, partial [Lysobacter sp.]|nr:hypothetical protein [Lysobacter sp.]
MYSLSSAGNVCWAKPNHAFSHCQQLRQKFFRGGVRRPRRKSSSPPTTTRDDRASRIARKFFEHAESYIWRGFQRISIFFSRARIALRASRRRVPERVPSVRSRPSAAAAEGAAFRAAQADLRKSARTFSAAADAAGDRRRVANRARDDVAPVRSPQSNSPRAR